MPAVDELDIKISASVNDALKSLDNVIRKIKGLEDALNSGVKGNGIEKQAQALKSFAETVKTVSDSIGSSMKGISSSIDPQVSQITKTFTRLANAGDKSTQVSNSLPKIGNTLNKLATDMSKIGNIDSNINKFVSSIARLANAGDKSAIAAKELPRLGDALKRITENMKNVDGISDSTNSFAQTIAQLANSGDKAGKAASGLSELSQRTLDFFNAMKEAPQISENTIRMTQAMAQLSATGGKVSASMKPVNSAFSTLSKTASAMAKTIKNALKTLASILSGTFSKIGQIGIKTANSMKKVAGDMVAAFSRITHSSKGLNSVSINLGNILKAIVGFKGIQGLMNFGKSALEFGSDITEVENVVDVAFGSMRKHAYDFASASTQQFGLSELAAKQYSGTMMAMLKSSGVMQSEAAKMSTTIAGLAGDIASFYNIDTDEAFYKLRSAISGETEPMKALGVNMNVVNLEAFALSRGITKAYKDMTLAEQATLRYNYILAKTTDAQGDFARTADTYANQIRLLKLNIQSLSGVLGQGLIAGILPAIKVLNMLMEKLMQAAQVFRNFMYTLVGKKLQGSMSGIVNDLAGIGDASESLNNLGDAAEEAGNKLKKKLFTLPFDELNVLSEDSDSLSDALGDIGNIDIGMEGFDDLLDTDAETPINIWAKRIRDAFLAQDWEGLGSTIAELLNKGLQKIYDVINWNNVGDKITKFVDAFTRTFNSLVDNFDWDLLGRTVGAGINTLVNTFNQLIEKIDFKNLGAKLSVGLRGMIDEIEWTGLGNAIGNWFMVSWRIADGFISDMWRVSADTMKNGWEELGIAVGEAVNGVFDRIKFDQIARVLMEGFRGILEAAANALDTIKFDVIAEKINAGLDALANGLAWEHIGEQITKFTAAISKAFNDLLGLDFGTVGRIIGNGITDIVRAFNQLTGENGINFELLGAKIAEGLRNLFASIPWNEFGNALGNGFMIGWRILDGFVTGMAQKNDAGITGWAQLGISIGNAINGIFEKIDFGAIGTLLSNGFNGLIDVIRNFIDTVDWDSIATNLTEGLNNFIHGVKWAEAGKTLNDFVMNLLDVFWQVARDTDWKSLGEGIGEFLSNIDWLGILGKVFDILWEVFSGLISGLFDTKAGKVVVGIAAGMAGLKIAFEGIEVISAAMNFVEKAKKVFGLLPDGLTTIIPKVTGKLTEIGTNLIEKVVPLISTGVSKIVGEGGLFSKIATGASGLVSNIGPVLGSIGSVIFSPTGLLIAGIAAGVILIIANWDKIKDAAGKLKDWVAEKWEGIKEKTSEIWGNIQDFLGKTWDNIKTWASEKFANIGKAISDSWSGIKETAQNVWGNIKNFLGDTWDKLKTSASEKFESIKEKLSDTWEKAKEKTSEAWENVKKTVGDKLSETSKDASEKFQKLQGEMDEHGKSVISGFTKGISSMANNLKTSVQEAASNAMNWFKDKLGIHSPSTVFRELGEYSLAGYSEGLKEGNNVVNAQMSDIVASSLKPFDGLGKKFNDMGTDMVSELDSGVSSQVSVVNEMMKQMAEMLKAAFASVAEMTKEVFGKIDSSAIAKNLMDGIANGISGNSGSVLGKIGSVASSMIDKFKSTLGIHSPSKVFYSLAEFTIEGFEQGIDSTENSLQRKMSSIASNIGQVFSEGFSENAFITMPPTNDFTKTIPASVTTNAVINDGQIISGIEEAAYRGFLRAQAETSPYLQEIADNTKRTADKDMSVRIGDRDVVNAYNRGTNRMGYSFQ